MGRPDSRAIDVFVGVDVGKTEHHAVALSADGDVPLDSSLPQHEVQLRLLVEDLVQHGSALFVVDQPEPIGALPLSVARSVGVGVGYLPGLAMRRIAHLHAGAAKTDARDAASLLRRPGLCSTTCASSTSAPATLPSFRSG